MYSPRGYSVLKHAETYGRGSGGIVQGGLHHGFGRIGRVALTMKDQIEFPFLDVGHARHEPLHVTEVDLQIKPWDGT